MRSSSSRCISRTALVDTSLNAVTARRRASHSPYARMTMAGTSAMTTSADSRPRTVGTADATRSTALVTQRRIEFSRFRLLSSWAACRHEARGARADIRPP